MAKKLNKKQLKKTKGGNFKNDWDVIKDIGKDLEKKTAPVHK